MIVVLGRKQPAMDVSLLIYKVLSIGMIFMRVRFKNRLCFIVALGCKQPAMAVSLLNFEPQVSKFPVI